MSRTHLYLLATGLSQMTLLIVSPSDMRVWQWRCTLWGRCTLRSHDRIFGCASTSFEFFLKICKFSLYFPDTNIQWCSSPDAFVCVYVCLCRSRGECGSCLVKMMWADEERYKKKNALVFTQSANDSGYSLQLLCIIQYAAVDRTLGRWERRYTFPTLTPPIGWCTYVQLM